MKKLSGFGMTILVCDPYLSAGRWRELGTVHTPLEKVLAAADVRKTLSEGLGMDLVVSTPEELQKWTLEHLARWGKIVRDNGIKTD